MKKITILFVALLVLSECFCNIHLSASQDNKTVRDIRIEVLVIGGGKPRPRPRSLLPIIEAESVGRVTISIKNSMGQVVSSCSCNTDIETMANLVVNNTPDFYTICIEGDALEASGFSEIFDY